MNNLCKILLAILALTAFAQPILQPPTVVHAASSIVLRTFTFNWNDTLMKLDVYYYAEVKANTFSWINVSITPVDFGSAKKIRIDVIQVEISDTVISITALPFKTMYWKNSDYKASFKLNFSDPSFKNIAPGNTAEYNLVIRVRGTLWDSDNNKFTYNFEGSAPIYIESPVVDLYSKIYILGEAVEDGQVDVLVEIINVGVESASNLKIEVECDAIDFKTPTTIRLPITLNPGESINVSFSGTFEEMGGWIVKAYITFLNTAGYNSSLTISKLVDVKGLSRIELYGNFSQGNLNLWGRLIPPRIGASATILMSKDGFNWTNLAVLDLETTGYFQYNIKLPYKGNYYFKATWSGDNEYLPSTSNILEVQVTKNLLELLLIAPTYSEVKPGEKLPLTIKTNINPPLNKTPIIIMGKFEEGPHWQPLKEIILNSSEVSFNITVPKNAEIVDIKAVICENENYYQSESNIIHLNIAAETPIYYKPTFMLPAIGIAILIALVVILIGRHKHIKILP